ncbi:MAG: methyltransferase domain-containing protein [Natronospirillum sp.]
MQDNISFYSENAQALCDQYENVHFEEVHKSWLNEIPKTGLVLDIGAGSGRDARYLAAKGLSVIAVEPADGMREKALQAGTDPSIQWLDDKLPELSHVFTLQMKFDLILLSAVWMHIAKSSRERSLRKLSNLLKPNGKLVISLRHGEFDDGRTMHPVSASELAGLASKFGLTCKLLSPNKEEDGLGRSNVSWETVVLELPDDGTGAFPLIRNIVMNDSKSSTYKVALLRTLLRIAEGHPGAVIDYTDDYVVLPMGLVALYWMKLFKPLIDQFSMQQNSDNNKGLGFIKLSGWQELQSYQSSDFFIGATYQSPMAESVYQTIKDIANTIKNMPAKYITLPGTERSVFDVELRRTQKPTVSLVLDSDFLASIGSFYVPVHIWDSLTRFSVWIEPTLINEWVTLMSSYRLNRERDFTKVDYLNALNWDNPDRTTSRIRVRVEQLLTSDNVMCCWTGKQIASHNFAVDHAFPFSRWPNNDLWNLLPTLSRVNTQKSDKLPTLQRLNESRELILHWWKQGWHEHYAEFFTQANFSLPQLGSPKSNFSDVFDAMCLQRERIKDAQQLRDW